MAIPQYQEIMFPLLKLLSDDQPHSISQINDDLANHFQLTDEEKNRPKASGNQALFRNRWGWTRFYLKKAGLLEVLTNYDTKITNEGQEFLRSNPPFLNKESLMKIPRFAEYIQKIKEKKYSQEQTDDSEDKSPEDKISDGIQEIRKNLEEDILEKIKESNPYYFEQIVVDLLEKMGYGHGQVTKRSGDEGIDGIITEDKLGFDEIYLQAKRWQHNVRSKDLRDFAGSLLAKKSRKGVFITTSDFSPDAKEFVEKADTKIILINGEKLAELMYDYNIGFETGENLELKKIDDGYFSNQ